MNSKKMRTYVIAEIGINHNNSMENCYKLIDSAVVAGCHAVKFQLFSAKHLYPTDAGMLDWQDDQKAYSYDIYKAVESFELPFEWIDALIEYCNNKKIDFVSSVFDTEGLCFLVKKGIKTIKLSSYTITNLALIEAVAKTGLRVFQSTGGATLSETEEAVNLFFKYNDKITLLHCSVQYPTELKNCNLGVIHTLEKAFPKCQVGYSDHTSEISEAPVNAVYLGARAIEKHITLDKKMDGPDHFFALEPNELKQMVKEIAQAETRYNPGRCSIDKKLYGETSRRCYDHEKYLRNFCYMTLFAKRPIRKGQQIKPDDLIILRPGKKRNGLKPKYIKLFSLHNISAKIQINKNDPITWDMVL